MGTRKRGTASAHGTSKRKGGSTKRGSSRARTGRGTARRRATLQRADAAPTGDGKAAAGQLPRVRRFLRRATLEVWLVDGAYVRKNIDEEFSNFGHHFTCAKVPRNEVWIDIEAHPDEHRFFARHAVLERRLMAKGADYDTAHRAANRAERAMRIQSGDLRKVQRGKSLPDPARVHTTLWKRLQNGVTVWLVSGRLVRSVFDIDFTEGGHDHVYEFVPPSEVWIDDDTRVDERGYVLFHELHERNLMARGMDYDAAHAESSKLEAYYRKHPAELHEALAAEGWA